MTQYECNHHNLSLLLKDRDHVKIESEPYMQLTVEKIEGTPFTCLSQYELHDGRPLRGPEIVFLEWKTTIGKAPSAKTVLQAKPIYYRNDLADYEEATIAGHFPADVPVLPGRQKVLDTFVQEWWQSIADQGFFEKARELAAERQARQVHAGPEVDDGPEMHP
jgi:hypothetical protein